MDEHAHVFEAARALFVEGIARGPVESPYWAHGFFHWRTGRHAFALMHGPEALAVGGAFEVARKLVRLSLAHHQEEATAPLGPRSRTRPEG